ncbi:PH domain-containing protein [Patescibacteria group bacterium]|jgi:uncharacterized membrane protein YdbT with pleckstrin-like domain|nr:PH domain-containing protein [Patescibacteria group bacterium]
MNVVAENESVAEIIHRHWFFLLREIILFGVIAFAPLVLLGVLGVLGWGSVLALPGNTTLLLFGAMLVWLAFVLPLATIAWTDYYLDTLVITDARLIAIEQKGLFSREVSSFRLDRIQDVTIEVEGLIATLLDFGTIHIQTAGEAREFLATYIPQPERVREAVSRAHNQAIERTQERAILPNNAPRPI